MRAIRLGRPALGPRTWKPEIAGNLAHDSGASRPERGGRASDAREKAISAAWTEDSGEAIRRLSAAWWLSKSGSVSGRGERLDDAAEDARGS